MDLRRQKELSHERVLNDVLRLKKKYTQPVRALKYQYFQEFYSTQATLDNILKEINKSIDKSFDIEMWENKFENKDFNIAIRTPITYSNSMKPRRKVKNNNFTVGMSYVTPPSHSHHEYYSNGSEKHHSNSKTPDSVFRSFKSNKIDNKFETIKEEEEDENSCISKVLDYDSPTKENDCNKDDSLLLKDEIMQLIKKWEAKENDCFNGLEDIKLTPSTLDDSSIDTCNIMNKYDFSALKPRYDQSISELQKDSNSPLKSIKNEFQEDGITSPLRSIENEPIFKYIDTKPIMKNCNTLNGNKKFVQPSLDKGLTSNKYVCKENCVQSSLNNGLTSNKYISEENSTSPSKNNIINKPNVKLVSKKSKIPILIKK